MKKSFLLLALAAGFTFTSCDKDDDAAPSKTEMLTNKSWKMTASTVSVNNGNPNDVYAMMPACNKDDFSTFTSDGKYTLDEGATKCNANAVQTQTGTWQFTENETKLKSTLGANTAEQTITELTSSKMVLTTEQTSTSNGTTTTYKYVTTLEAN